VDHYNGAFVGIDTSKLRNAIAVAEDGRGGDIRFLGEIDTAETPQWTGGEPKLWAVQLGAHSRSAQPHRHG